MEDLKNQEVSVELMVEDILYAGYKPTFCYACSQEIVKSARLICSDCLDDTCDQFVTLAEK